MGIKVEFNPDLALRNASEHKAGRRKLEECIPASLEKGKTYDFLKRGQRLYWLDGELPLVETKGEEELSEPVASIVITRATHERVDGEVWTRGAYKVVEVFTDGGVHFNGFARAKG